MNYMSVCSGVEAASLAWEGLGWKPVAFSEIEPFPCAVLAERFPGVPNLGDMTKIEVTDDEIHGAGFTIHRKDVELLVGGTPCQSFSVAGRREGLKGASGLAYHFVRLLREIQPKWFVWENVPGALSSRTDGQLDFNFLVGAFAECGYGLAWRILDAQYVRSKSFPLAIPQRRRRLFVVGCLGDGESAGKVLFDGESLPGDTPPRRTTAQRTSGCVEVCADIANGEKVTCYENHAQSSRVVESEISPTLNCMGGGSGMLPLVLEEGNQGIPSIQRLTTTSDAQRMPAKGVHGVAYGINCQASLMHPFSEEVSQVITVAHQSGVAREECFPIDMRNATRDADKKDDVNRQGSGIGQDGSPAPTVTANTSGVCWRGTVRRLLPVETERLMGFPDNWTRIPWRGKPAEQCPDGPRYKACGNSFCVNCMEWIGERIEKAERELQEG